MRQNVGLVMLLLVAVGCADSSRKNPYVWQSEVSDSLLKFRDEGPVDAVKQLSDFTPFAWDSAYYFRPGLKKRDIDKALGIDFLSSSTSTGATRYDDMGPLLVFTKGSDVVHAVVATPPLMINGEDFERYEYDSASVRATSKGTAAPFMLNLQKAETHVDD